MLGRERQLGRCKGEEVEAWGVWKSEGSGGLCVNC